ncbi:sugar phosphate isomerase/epimerase [Arthrobacter sp. ISL-48]|uniref:sugar phosphate isomerase/epimerase family protein n=1 Tax=Arthrobacter sp. ISL-48 TaxID=2819110 RepID=UPI001BE5BCD8|nr:sugar phosphate isomerase/epimerase [Arthrobacter sp. ISL-48]MBT2531217.1 sugar phosphate isomerase/epimerase [Arthrobacter sp. ISL-48]
MSYSIQLYTVRKALEEDLPGTIQRLAEIGFTMVEPYRFVAKAAELKQALADNNLTAPSGHAPLLQENQDDIFAAAQQLGIGTVIDPHVPIERWSSLSDIKKTAEQLNAAAAKGAQYGVRVGYHNHWWEVESVIDGRTALEHLADNLDPAVVLELDTYWAAVGGQDPSELLARLGDRVKFIHIKDGPLSPDPSRQTAVGDGKMAIWDVLDAAGSLEAGVIELDDFQGDMFEAVRDSYNYLSAGKVSA